MKFDRCRSRRNILKWGSAAASVMIAGVALPNFGIDPALADDLGEGDTAILNYAYALEQLEAAFYTRVLDVPFHGVTSDETNTFAQIRDHETAHREFFKKALGESAISEIKVDFSSVNFESRDSVLGTADAFENLGIAAFNGAAPLLQKVDYLAAAASIVSVEARHAAMIAALLHGPSAASAGGSYISSKGLDGASSPTKVLPTAKRYIRTPLFAKSFA
jgi:hypothetical protein